MTHNIRLRRLREAQGYGTQKTFCHHAQKQGYKMTLRRYGAIERGDVKPDIDEIIAICEAMKVSADAWLFGLETPVDVRGLTEKEISLVKNLVKDLVAFRR